MNQPVVWRMAAIARYHTALTLLPRTEARDDWATTLNNLGIAFGILGERESGTERLEQAVVAYEQALEEYTRDRVPLGWAMSSANLAGALTVIGERAADTVPLREAVAIRESVLALFQQAGASHYIEAETRNLAIARAALARVEAGEPPPPATR